MTVTFRVSPRRPEGLFYSQDPALRARHVTASRADIPQSLSLPRALRVNHMTRYSSSRALYLEGGCVHWAAASLAALRWCHCCYALSRALSLLLCSRSPALLCSALRIQSPLSHILSRQKYLTIFKQKKKIPINLSIFCLDFSKY